MTLKTVFEKETCGRCGGCGRYSYNQMHGSTCYGCGGTGERLTKRGAVASAFYVESCKVIASEIAVGDMIGFAGVTLGGSPYTRRGRVQQIEHGVQRWKQGGDVDWREAPTISFWRTTPSGQEGTTHYPTATLRKYWPTEINDAKIAAALAHQATLGKNGKPLAMKQKAAVAA